MQQCNERQGDMGAEYIRRILHGNKIHKYKPRQDYIIREYTRLIKEKTMKMSVLYKTT